MSYNVHEFGKIYNAQLTEMDAQIKANSSKEVVPIAKYRSENILDFVCNNKDERILNNGNVIVYNGRLSWWFKVDPNHESGEYYFWIGKQIDYAVYDNVMIVFYSDQDKHDSTTFISKIDVNGTAGGASRMEGVKINVPEGCMYVGITGTYSTSGGTINGSHTIDGVPQIIVSKRFVPYQPYWLDEKPDKLIGTRIYWNGDSIIAGLYCNSKMSKKIDELYGTGSVNKAVSDTMIYNGTIASFVDGMPEIEPDIFITDGGCNDMAGSKMPDGISAWDGHHGEIDAGPPSLTKTYDVTTVCGAFEAYIQKVRTKYPKAKIVYVLVHYCGTSARPYTTQKALGDAFLEICKKWSVSVVNIRDEGNINSTIDTNFTTSQYGPDGTHPSDDAHYKYYIPMIIAKLREILPD